MIKGQWAYAQTIVNSHEYNFPLYARTHANTQCVCVCIYIYTHYLHLSISISLSLQLVLFRSGLFNWLCRTLRGSAYRSGV